MSQSLFDLLNEGIEAYRKHGTRPVRKPIRPHILDIEEPEPNDCSYIGAGKRCGIPGYQLEVLIDFIINDEEGTFLSQMSDILLQAKLAYDGSEIDKRIANLIELKEVYNFSYQREVEHYEEYQRILALKERPMNTVLSKMIDEAKKFDPALPFTSTMLGIVSALWKYSGMKFPGKINPDIYPSLLEKMDWSIVDKLLDVEDDQMKQQLISNAKGIACQNGKEAVFYLDVPLPEVIRL